MASARMAITSTVGELKLMTDTEAVMSPFDPRWDRLAGRVGLVARCSHPDAVDELHETPSQLGGGSHLALHPAH